MIEIDGDLCESLDVFYWPAYWSDEFDDCAVCNADPHCCECGGRKRADYANIRKMRIQIQNIRYTNNDELKPVANRLANRLAIAIG